LQGLRRRGDGALRLAAGVGGGRDDRFRGHGRPFAPTAVWGQRPGTSAAHTALGERPAGTRRCSIETGDRWRRGEDVAGPVRLQEVAVGHRDRGRVRANEDIHPVVNPPQGPDLHLVEMFRRTQTLEHLFADHRLEMRAFLTLRIGPLLLFLARGHGFLRRSREIGRFPGDSCSTSKYGRTATKVARSLERVPAVTPRRPYPDSRPGGTRVDSGPASSEKIRRTPG